MNPYREPAKLPEKEKFSYIDHVYIPDWAKGYSFMIRASFSNIQNIKIYEMKSRRLINIDSCNEVSGTIIIDVPWYCESYLCIAYNK